MIWRRLLAQVTVSIRSSAVCSAGNSSATSRRITAITISNSTRVRPWRARLLGCWCRCMGKSAHNHHIGLSAGLAQKPAHLVFGTDDGAGADQLVHFTGGQRACLLAMQADDGVG